MSTYSNGPGNVPRLPERVVDTLIDSAGVSRLAPHIGSSGRDQTESIARLVHATCEELLARLPASPVQGAASATSDTAASATTDHGAAVSDEEAGLRIIKFIEGFDKKLEAKGFTHEQRCKVVGALMGAQDIARAAIAERVQANLTADDVAFLRKLARHIEAGACLGERDADRVKVIAESVERAQAQPIPTTLHCPACFALHVDEGEWATKPHKTHQCQACWHEWRPYEHPTVGVAEREQARQLSAVVAVVLEKTWLQWLAENGQCPAQAAHAKMRALEGLLRANPGGAQEGKGPPPDSLAAARSLVQRANEFVGERVSPPPPGQGAARPTGCGEQGLGDLLEDRCREAAQVEEAALEPIYYMRDNHTFRELTGGVEAALRTIEEELEAGYTSGLLYTGRPGAKASLGFSYATPRDEMLNKARDWLADEINAREPAALAAQQAKTGEGR